MMKPRIEISGTAMSPFGACRSPKTMPSTAAAGSTGIRLRSER
jgi:hypothetical protein